MSVTEFQDLIPHIHGNIPYHDRIVGFQNLHKNIVIPHPVADAFTDIILIFPRAEFCHNIIVGPVPVNQKHLPRRKNMLINKRGNIDPQHDPCDLQRHHVQIDLRRVERRDHDGYLAVGYYVRQQCGKHLGEDHLSVFQVSDPHSPVHAGKKENKDQINCNKQRFTFLKKAQIQLDRFKIEII